MVKKLPAIVTFEKDFDQMFKIILILQQQKSKRIKISVKIGMTLLMISWLLFYAIYFFPRE